MHKTLFIGLMVISSLSVMAEDKRFTREFMVPRGFHELLKKKYHGESYKELLNNAGANLADKDFVIPPSGAGLIVHSSLSNLKTIEDLISRSALEVSSLVNHHEVKALLMKSHWDFSSFSHDRFPIGVLKLNKGNLGVGKMSDRRRDYRWALTKQNILELRADTGELLLTASLNFDGTSLLIVNIGSSPNTNIEVKATKPSPDQKKEAAADLHIGDDPFASDQTKSSKN